MKARPHGDAPVCQGRAQCLCVHVLRDNGKHPRLGRQVWQGKHLQSREPPQALRRLEGQLPLSGADGLRPQLADESDPRQQPCDAGHIVGARLQPIRQEVRHLLLDRDAAGAALQQCADGDVLPAQQYAGSLGAVQALVARHGDEGRTRPAQADRQRSRGLRSVDDERDAAFPAQRGNGGHGQHIAVDI